MKVRSKTYEIKRGVPQGSILGPLLFLVYINDLPVTLKETILTLFADDTTLTVSGKSTREALEKAEIHLKKLIEWTNYNQLVLNPSKSSFLNYSQSECEKIALNELTCIERNYSTKFLGVIINEKLNWNEHIEATCSKIILYCYGLFKTRSILNISALKSIYYGYIYPHLKYGIICWGNSNKAHDIFKIQKRAIRNIVGANKMDSCKPHFKTLGILTVYSIYILESATFVKNNQHLFKTNGYHYY